MPIIMQAQRKIKCKIKLIVQIDWQNNQIISVFWIQ